MTARQPDLMIIDDSEDQQQLMQNVCKMIEPNLQIITAECGAVALKYLRAQGQGQLPKVILLDLRMPGMSGQEVLSELKSDLHLKRIPVCIFSNADLETEICDCYERGANFYFKKPTGLVQLKKFLEHFSGIWFKFASVCPN